MLRFSSLLVIVLLAVPLVRDCCLPPAQTLPCHGASPGEDQSCILNQATIIPVSSDAASLMAVFPFPITTVDADHSYPLAGLAGPLALPHLFISDVNLRTGALLI
jgi:hypothetical protein